VFSRTALPCAKDPGTPVHGRPKEHPIKRRACSVVDNSFTVAVETCTGARRAANTQPRQRLALLLVATSPFERVLESNTYRALPLAADCASAFKSRQPDHKTPRISVLRGFLFFLE
jgi:hypothetical protein